MGGPATKNPKLLLIGDRTEIERKKYSVLDRSVTSTRRTLNQAANVLLQPANLYDFKTHYFPLIKINSSHY